MYRLCSLVLLIAVSATACLAAGEEPADSEAAAVEQLEREAWADPALADRPTGGNPSFTDGPRSTATLRACNGHFDCQSGCSCNVSGVCVPDGFGPANPNCSNPPLSICANEMECQHGCDCVSGTCVPDGFGPANPNCGATSPL
ncbi:MAG: hypothetical protein ACRBN8_02235 [Nannocystales bacterium]